MKVFLANGGWVKMFDDGQVAGPVRTKAEADAILSPEQAYEKVEGGNFSSSAKGTNRAVRVGRTGCRKSNY